jgi:hypothetical protein
MSVGNRNECRRGTGRNQQLQRCRFRVNLNVIEASNLLRNRLAQLGDTLGRAVMIPTCLDQVTGSLGQRWIDG